MMWWRMLAVGLRLAGRHVLAPWRSPLLRWRVETYGVQAPDGRLLHAAELTPVDFARFLLARRAAILRFLRWAASL